MAGLLADAARRRRGPVLLWHTARRGPLPHEDRWRERLPPALSRRLSDPGAAATGRRRVLWALGLGALAAVAGVRLGGTPALPAWSGAALSARDARILAAAAEALLPAEATAEERGRVPIHIDRYLIGMPPRTLREVRAMLMLIEHGTTPLGGRLRRFTALAPAEREAYLAGLEARGGLLAQAYRGLRDLVMLAYYQQPSTWAAIGYEGPRVPLDYDPHGPDRMVFPAYDSLVAPEGAMPRGFSP
jgi:D-cysteine desulfhydrase